MGGRGGGGRPPRARANLPKRPPRPPWAWEAGGQGNLSSPIFLHMKPKKSTSGSSFSTKSRSKFQNFRRLRRQCSWTFMKPTQSRKHFLKQNNPPPQVAHVGGICLCTFCLCQGEKLYLKHVFQGKLVQSFKNFGACGAENALSNKGCLENFPTAQAVQQPGGDHIGVLLCNQFCQPK